MRLSRTALACSTLCFLSLTACGPKRVALPIKPPPERLGCVAAGERPSIPPEHVIDWTKVQTVDQARAEHLRYVASIRSREGVIVGYVVWIERRLFTCSTNAAWLRDWYARL